MLLEKTKEDQLEPFWQDTGIWHLASSGVLNQTYPGFKSGRRGRLPPLDSTPRIKSSMLLLSIGAPYNHAARHQAVDACPPPSWLIKQSQLSLIFTVNCKHLSNHTLSRGLSALQSVLINRDFLRSGHFRNQNQQVRQRHATEFPLAPHCSMLHAHKSFELTL